MADMLQNLQPTQNMTPQGTWWGGRPEFTQQTPLLTGQQQGLQNNAIQQLMQMLQQGGGFGPIEDQARTNFQSNTIPLLAERFQSLGGAGTGNSSAFQGALGAAGSGLEQGLASLKSQHNLGQQGLLSQLGMQQSFQNNHFQRQPGLPENFFNALGGGLGAILPYLPMLFGAPPIPGLGGGNKQGQQQQSNTQMGGGMNNMMNAFGMQPFQIPQSSFGGF